MEEQKCLSPSAGSPCDSAMNENNVLIYAQQDTLLNRFIVNSTNGYPSGVIPIVIKSPSLVEKGTTYRAQITMLGFDSAHSVYTSLHQAPKFNVEWSIGKDSLLKKNSLLAAPEFSESVSALLVAIGIAGAIGASTTVVRRQSPKSVSICLFSILQLMLDLAYSAYPTHSLQ
jgi:hypothetical protein